MAHRLLHTLVFSSTILLDACGSSSASTAAEATPTEGGEEVSSNETGTGALAANDAPFDASDFPACAPRDPGWPTTKGRVCQADASGINICCSIVPVSPDNSSCCAVSPQVDPS